MKFQFSGENFCEFLYFLKFQTKRFSKASNTTVLSFIFSLLHFWEIKQKNNYWDQRSIEKNRSCELMLCKSRRFKISTNNRWIFRCRHSREIKMLKTLFAFYCWELQHQFLFFFSIFFHVFGWRRDDDYVTSLCSRASPFVGRFALITTVNCMYDDLPGGRKRNNEKVNFYIAIA